jgi:hypothetical protein
MCWCRYIIIIIIIIIIYNYITETNHVSRVYKVATIPELTIQGTCNAISHYECFTLLRQHFPQYVRSVQYGGFLQFLDFMLSQ